MLKKCSAAVSSHKNYDDKFRTYTTLLSKANEQYQQLAENAQEGNREEIAKRLSSVESLLAERHPTLLELNTMIECGDQIMATTASEGRDSIKAQVNDCQQSTDALYDNLSRLERELQARLNRWAGFEESSSAFNRWLQDTESLLSGDIVLKSTLDEKKGQLQIYRNMLQDIKGQKPVLDDLKEKASFLPEQTESTTDFLTKAVSRHSALMEKAQKYVENYEAIVSDHHQYTKAVMEASEWTNATLNTIEMWGDTSLDRLSLHANLERLKSLQLTLPEEEFRTTDVRRLAEKVLPGTSSSGQANVRAQIDTSMQEWQNLVSTIKSYLEGVEAKIRQWGEFESVRDGCLNWLRETDTLLHTFDLKATLPEKEQQLEVLKSLQGQIKAKEIEIDAVTDRAQQLSKDAQGSRQSQLTELSVKYQHINMKVRDLVAKWQQLVTSHGDYDKSLAESRQWIVDKSAALVKVSEASIASQKDIDAKMRAVSDLLLTKDEGFGKVQTTISLAQSVLANTAPEGHDTIKKDVADLQQKWGSLVSKVSERKLTLDDSAHQGTG